MMLMKKVGKVEPKPYSSLDLTQIIGKNNEHYKNRNI
jgi:hypothetical protein